MAQRKTGGSHVAAVNSRHRNAYSRILQRYIDARVMLKSGEGLELLFAVAIWGMLLGVALPEYSIAIPKARHAALWNWVAPAKVEIALYYAVHGRWPNSDDLMGEERLLDDVKSHGLKSVQIRDGSFNIVLADRPGNEHGQWNLSFRRQRQVPGAPVHWLCGQAKPSAPIDAPPNLTDLDPRIMPWVCRP